jgi:hypothetical protein
VPLAAPLAYLLTRWIALAIRGIAKRL